VSFEKIRHVLGFTPQHRIEDGVREVRELLASGSLDAGASVYSNLKHLREIGFGGPQRGDKTAAAS
jgi:hypothetical protein